MQQRSLAVLLGYAAAALAKTPDGFQPASNNDLIVAFGAQSALNGVNLPKADTAQEPTFGTTEPLTGKSFAIIMVDIDVPSAAGTFLHWAQTDLAPDATTKTVQLGADGERTIHTLSIAGGAAAIADYRGPSPPARNPLTHRYVELLVDTSDITPEGTQALQALSNRQGAQVNDVLTQAGLANKVVAGNFFTVTNGQ
ncbi:phosphatidylethanolamine-binding protein [Colletotrichum plurivorum]|uniref:Phosphatidylethanolamine-binding protein n=2 Tax=Colletotrichum orchidearum species complex TaxID=2707337 RepID=A0A8H6K1L3_9PEZI|nr:phosphatidylethanolamine-binding protein [Colletotrichum sojae]KAF6823033.1 phosphatidylethanolamine-binding protein [Colletotrichum plurivorum]